MKSGYCHGKLYEEQHMFNEQAGHHVLEALPLPGPGFDHSWRAAAVGARCSTSPCADTVQQATPCQRATTTVGDARVRQSTKRHTRVTMASSSCPCHACNESRKELKGRNSVGRTRYSDLRNPQTREPRIPFPGSPTCKHSSAWSGKLANNASKADKLHTAGSRGWKPSGRHCAGSGTKSTIHGHCAAVSSYRSRG